MWQQSLYFTEVHILLSLMAFLGNFLILIAFHKVCSLHPPSKLLYRCLETTDLLVSIVSQPLIAPYWMFLVQKEWYLCRCTYKATNITAYMHYVQCGQTSSPVVGAKIKTNSVYFMVATFWVPFGVAGLCYILDYRIDMSSPFYTLYDLSIRLILPPFPLRTMWSPSPPHPPPEKRVFYIMITSSFQYPLALTFPCKKYTDLK